MKKKLNEFVSMYVKPVLGNVKAKRRFMALAVDKSTLNKKIKYGIAREITKSQGNPDIPGFIDKSKLILVKSNNLLSWKKVSDLKIREIDKVINSLSSVDRYLIGLEDPDIINENKIKHLYFTIAFKLKDYKEFIIYLGHAEGDNLNSLRATEPVLYPIEEKGIYGFKELAFVPGYEEINLNEAILKENINDYGVSVITLSECRGLDSKWIYKKILLKPGEMKYNWCKGHLSPCKILPKDYIFHNDLLVGIVNGRERGFKKGDSIYYGKFCPGLFLFNPKTREIPWIDKEPLFEDPDASTITFASDFIELSKNKGLLYCHINDSFVRAYEIDLGKIKERVEKNFISPTS